MAGKMDQRTTIVLAVVGSLGLLSVILGFSAEGTKITRAIRISGSCYYPQNPSVGLGVCAAIFLVIAQVTIAVVGGCCGCCKSRVITNRVVIIVCAVFSWITAVIAFGLFVHGASSNTSGWRDASGSYSYGYYYYGLCDVPGGGIFAGAAVLTLAATALGITSYVLLRRQPDAAPAAAPVAAAPEVATGQPQFPLQTPPKGNGQTPPPKNGQFPPPPTQEPVAHAPNQQFPPPAQGYEAHGPSNQQFPLPDPGHGAPAANQHRPPRAQGYAAQAPKIEVDPSNLLNLGEQILRVATLISDDGAVDESTAEDPAHYQEPSENYIHPEGGCPEHLEEV